MNKVLQIGPFVLPFSLLLLAAAVVAALLLGKRMGRTANVAVEPILWESLLAGLVVARLGFVFEFREAYLAAPLSIVDIRDGGWSITAGVIGAWLFGLHQVAKRPSLKKPLASALMLGTVVLTAGTLAMSLKPDVGQQLPTLALTGLDGKSIPLDQFKGRPTVVNLWATWCPPCRREMPLLHQAQRDHPAVSFVFLNQGESADRVQAWLAAQHLPLQNVLLDETWQAGAAFGQKALPTTLFFNAAGELMSTRIGELSAATLEQRLESMRPAAH